MGGCRRSTSNGALATPILPFGGSYPLGPGLGPIIIALGGDLGEDGDQEHPLLGWQIGGNGRVHGRAVEAQLRLGLYEINLFQLLRSRMLIDGTEGLLWQRFMFENHNGVYLWCSRFHLLMACPAGGGEGSSLRSKNMVQAGEEEVWATDEGPHLGPWLLAIRQWLLGLEARDDSRKKGLSQLDPGVGSQAVPAREGANSGRVLMKPSEWRKKSSGPKKGAVKPNKTEVRHSEQGLVLAMEGDLECSGPMMDGLDLDHREVVA
ncbi:hypothetical protein COCNU_08G001780 [Cocos nucifera]|uniref:Uncharacterized protein n=1 Tax=Cocos nucifera TaxID=13894 RepID=A0A8K0IHI6_COCNU|nr:hypothetical protein COCNU_08G001780 [Cocos nucifera]